MPGSTQPGINVRSTLALLVLIAATDAFAQGSTFSVAPSYQIPMGGSSSLYAAGIGANLDAGIPSLFGPLDGTVRAGYTAALLDSQAGTIHIASLSAGPSALLYSRGRFSLDASMRLGAFAAFYANESPLFNPATSAQIDARLNLGSMSLALSPGYDLYWARRDGSVAPFYSALSFGLTLTYAAGGGSAKPKLKIDAPELDPFFPAIYKYYADNKFGNVQIRNGESVEARDVKVEFFVPRYMEGPSIVAEFPALKAGETRTVPLTALLRNEVLGVTETDAVQVEITISYNARSSVLSVRRSGNLRVESRNAVSWDDDRKAAAFVTAKDPTILKLSRNAVAASGSSGAVFSESFRKGMIAFAALSEYGIRYVIDPASSYKELSKASGIVDYVQFPVQTLDYRTGDCDDLTVLYCSFLEALGLETAFITTPGHIYAAFALDLTELEAQRVFASTENLIIRDGRVWLPVEATALSSGFLSAWADGAREWREASSQGTAKLFPVRAAWAVFEPTFISSTENLDVVGRFPDSARIGKSFDATMKTFTEREMAVLEKGIKARISARSTPGLLNSLGTLYARYGFIDKAEASFQQAAKDNYAPALHNLGNIRFIKKDYKGALELYERAVKSNPDFAEAALGVARAQFELGRFDRATTAYKTAKIIDPRKAEAYAYLGGESSASGRASDPAQRAAVSWTDQ